MKKLLLLLIISVPLLGQAQIETYLNQYYNNWMLISPAMTGVEGSHKINMHVRNQWTGFKEAPRTYALSYDGAISEGRYGIGGSLMLDNIGNVQRYTAGLNYAFHLKMKSTQLSIGMNLRYLQYQINNDILSNPLYDTNDEIIEGAVDGRREWDATIGLAFKSHSGLYIGISAPNLVSSQLEESSLSNDFYYTGIAGYKIKVDEQTSVEPSIIHTKVKDSPAQTSLNIKTSFGNERVVIGGGYHLGLQSINLLVGSNFYKNMYFYYSYDFTLSGFKAYNSGSHEITISIGLGEKPDNTPTKKNNNKKKKDIKPIYF